MPENYSRQRSTNILKKTIHRSFGLLLLLLSAFVIAAPAAVETVIVPIKLDYPLLQQLMVTQLFDTPSQKVEVLRDPAGCSKIFLSDPYLSEQRQKLEITAHVKAKIATDIFGRCTGLFDWVGDARFLAEPVILPGARSVKLNILSTRLYNPQGELVSSGPLWDLADGQLQSMLSRYEVDLNPSINELGKLMPHLLRRHSAQQINRITNSLRLAGMVVTPDGIDVDISLKIDRLPRSSQQEAILTAGELQQMEANWQMMDAMITNAVKHYAAATELEDLHEVLLEILLDARYRLMDALAMPVSRSDDPVRHWFIQSWQRLGPVLRQISLEKPGQEPMLIVSLLTAANALRALDRLGPAIGLDISADGLRRMGRMLINQPGIDPLRYEDTIDPELRRLFKLPDASGSIEPTGFYFNLWPVRSAWAKSSDERLNLWVPQKKELPKYLPIMRDLLIANANQIAKEKKLEPSITKLYRHMVLTTAWQESCWRQYVVEKKKIVPLRSNTGDSGLMQLNERVWRGFYDPQKLRWDINYNARAGAEVLSHYLVKYALKRDEHKRSGGLDNLARASYSAYNGGPGQTSRYRNPKAASSHKKIDAAFWKKYQAVKQGREMQVAECLGGDPNSIAARSPKQAPPKKPIDKKINKQPSMAKKSVGKAWVFAQDKHHYTLQLAVFSSLKAADKFRSENNLQGIVAIAPLGKDRQGQFVVLNGSYKTKSEAERQKQRYKKLKPWVRQFSDIRSTIR